MQEELEIYSELDEYLNQSTERCEADLGDVYYSIREELEELDGQ
jgi:hypothetical protein